MPRRRRFARSPVLTRRVLPSRSPLALAVHAGIDALLALAFRQWAREEIERAVLAKMRLAEVNPDSEVAPCVVERT